MSVYFFGTKQLAEIAVFAADGSREDLAEMAKHLAAYSEANAATFMARYPRREPAVVAVTASEIEARARQLGPILGNVLQHAGLLRYNVEELDVVVAAGVATVIDRVLGIAGGRVGR